MTSCDVDLLAHDFETDERGYLRAPWDGPWRHRAATRTRSPRWRRAPSQPTADVLLDE